MQLEHKPKKSDITISFEYYGSILEYFHEFRINREELNFRLVQERRGPQTDIFIVKYVITVTGFIHL